MIQAIFNRARSGKVVGARLIDMLIFSPVDGQPRAGDRI
jgi:hypothetical protein